MVDRSPATYKLTIEYDGTAFHGWQKQNHVGKKRERTVQGELEDCISRLLDERISTIASSRTDAGVHALAQVVSFSSVTDIKPVGFSKELNGILPKDILIKRVEKAARGFNARYGSSCKEYEYFILNSDAPSSLYKKTSELRWEYRHCEERSDAAISVFREGKRRDCRALWARNDDHGSTITHRLHYWWIKEALDISKMKLAAKIFIGKKDFASVGKRDEADRGSVCNVEVIRITKKGPLISILFKGDRFLWNMVRNIVGALVSVGCGRKRAEWIDEIVSKKRIDPRLRKAAPAKGLYLKKVYY